jgi:signal transduction histidine kinase
MFTIGSVLTPVFYLTWVLAMTNAKHTLWKYLSLVIYLLVVLTLFLLWSPLFIIGTESKLIFDFWPIPGPLYLPHIILVYIVPITAGMARVVYLWFTTTNNEEKGRMLYVILGSLFGFVGAGTNFFLWYDIPLLPYGNFLIILFPPLLGYSIVRYHMFTLRAVATEVLVFFTTIGVFAQIFNASTATALVLQIIFFVGVAFSSYLLLRSVYSEIKIREQLENLTEQLKHTNERLRELDRQKSEFLSIATHQLRGPLAAIRGHLSLILDGSYGDVPKKAKEVVQRVFDSGGLMAETINDFLNVSRIEQGSMKYEKERLSCDELVADIVQDLHSTAKSKKLSLTFTDKCDGTCYVYADAGKLRHIFFNLIDNAIKYTPKGAVKVALIAKPEEHTVRIEVTDSGVGIDQNEITTLFEKFVRTRDASGINVDGTGLGLYVAREMVEAHNGKIWAESPGKGKGSTFIVELPMVK